MTPIKSVEVIPIVVPGLQRDDLDGTVETVIVKIFDDDGRYGFGEADAPADVVKSFLDDADGASLEPKHLGSACRPGSRRNRSTLAEGI